MREPVELRASSLCEPGGSRASRGAGDKTPGLLPDPAPPRHTNRAGPRQLCARLTSSWGCWQDPPRGLLGRLNEVIQVKLSKQCLACAKCSINGHYYFYFQRNTTKVMVLKNLNLLSCSCSLLRKVGKTHSWCFSLLSLELFVSETLSQFSQLILVLVVKVAVCHQLLITKTCGQ